MTRAKTPPAPLPCPFCGVIPHAYHDGVIACYELRCHMQPSTGQRSSDAVAIRRWNRRAPVKK